MRDVAFVDAAAAGCGGKHLWNLEVRTMLSKSIWTYAYSSLEDQKETLTNCKETMYRGPRCNAVHLTTLEIRAEFGLKKPDFPMIH